MQQAARSRVGSRLTRLGRVGAAAIMTMALTIGTAGFSAAAEPQQGGSAPAQGSDATSVDNGIANATQVIVRWKTAGPGIGPAADARARTGSLGQATGREASFVRMLATGSAVYSVGALGKDADRIIRAISRLPGVVHAVPDRILYPITTPADDPALTLQLWGLTHPGDANASASEFGIDAVGAWAQVGGAGNKGQGITVAVIDTGILGGSAAHEDLVGQILPGYDFISDAETANDTNGRDADPTDPGDWCENSDSSSWHGSHVAGTIAALAGNGKGVFGGAPEADILPVRVLGRCGGTTSDIIDGMLWASGVTVGGVPNPNPARVENLSLGGFGACDAEQQTAIDTIRSRGTVVVVAAGNSNHRAELHNPASCNGVITVAATDINGRKADFSNFGPQVEVAGPGVDIQSTINSGSQSPDNGGSIYESYNGTSMATPHVAAAAALVAQAADAVGGAAPKLGPDAILAVLQNTVTAFGVDGTVNSCQNRGCGVGIVDANRAVAAIRQAYPSVGLIVPPAAGPGTAIAVTARAVDVNGVTTAQVSIGGGAPVAMTLASADTNGQFKTFTSSVVMPPGGAGNVAVCVRATDGTNLSPGTGADCANVIRDPAPAAAVAPAFANGSIPGRVVTISSAVSDAVTTVAGAEYSIDAGAFKPMTAADGAFGSNAETAVASVGAQAANLSAGYLHACAVLPDGTVRCWGNNYDHEVGYPTTEDTFSNTPAESGGWSGAVQVAAGGFHTCVLLGSGRVSCVGYGEFGALGDGVDRYFLSDPSVAVPVNVSGITTAVSIASGLYHSCALLSNGTVKCWGNNGDAQLGDGTKTRRPAPVTVKGLNGVKAISAGDYHTCALLSSGSVKCWGWNGWGQLGTGSNKNSATPVAVKGITTATSLASNTMHNCVRLTTGAVKCWGRNVNGQIGNGKSGSNAWAPSPATVVGVSGAASVGTGVAHSCAVLKTGGVKCWGSNFFREIDGTGLTRTTGVTVAGVSGATSVVAGLEYTCARKSTGEVLCWGRNDFGSTGAGTSPVNDWVSDYPAVQAVGFGGALATGRHTACVRATDAAGQKSAASCGDFLVGKVTAGLALGTIPAAAAGSALRISIGWDLGTSPFINYEVDENVANAGFSAAGVVGGAVKTLPAQQPQGTRIQYRVRGVAAGPVTGPNVAGAPFGLRSFQHSSSLITFAGKGWASKTAASSFGGSTKVNATKGATATMTFLGTSVAWVATKGKTQGKAAVYVDGSLKATINLYRSSTSARAVVFVANGLPAGRHTITIKVLGTKSSAATSARVDIDGFLVLSPLP